MPGEVGRWGGEAVRWAWVFYDSWLARIPSVQTTSLPPSHIRLLAWYEAEYPHKFHFRIPCVFPVRPQIFPVPIYMICDYYIHKTDLADLSSLIFFFFFGGGGGGGEFSRQISKYLLPLESGNLQLEQTKFPVFSQCFGKMSKFPVFSLTRIFVVVIFPVFPVPWVP